MTASTALLAELPLPYIVNGLPLHILLVHFVVIVLPAGSLMTFVGAVWPAFRRKLGILTPIVTFAALLSVPLATNAGEWLAARVASTPLIQAHVALGDTLLPWAVGQFVVATAIWAWYRWFAVRPGLGRGIRIGVTIAAIVVSAAIGATTIAKVVHIGESGASAVWTGSFTDQPQ